VKLEIVTIEKEIIKMRLNESKIAEQILKNSK
jgi:hypothetical protein